MKKRTAIISGGAGFLGSSLTESLIPKYIIFNLGKDSSHLCENIHWDMHEKLDFKKMPESADAIIHCASIVGDNPQITGKEYMAVNVRATADLLEYASKNKVKHFIYISTGGVYGFSDAPFDEDSECRPEGRYAVTKYLAELICRHYEKSMKMTILRLFFPYGPGQKDRFIPKIINQIQNGDTVTLNQGGLPIINPIHVSDACKMISDILERGITGTFNVAGADESSIEDICKTIAKNLSKKLKIAYNGKKTKSLIGSNRKITAALGYQPKKRLQDGIKELCSYAE